MIAKEPWYAIFLDASKCLTYKAKGPEMWSEWRELDVAWKECFKLHKPVMFEFLECTKLLFRLNFAQLVSFAR